MYDPTIGRWMSEDPLGFEADDPNLYRYVQNKATMATDPSGLVPPSDPLPGYFPDEHRRVAIEREHARALQLQGQPLSDHFRVQVEFECNAFSLEERRSIRTVMLQAAQRIEYALIAIRDEWDPIQG